MKFPAALTTIPPVLVASSVKQAPLFAPRDQTAIPGRYIVRLNSGASAISAMSTFASQAIHTYDNLGGFLAEMTHPELEILRRHPDVAFVEQDAMVHTMATQNGATWGIARLSSGEAGGTTYTYDDTAGTGTCAYVIDTGIDVDHEEFEGRAIWLENFSGDGDDTDGAGHGTHCAGTIGSKTYGVAKKTSLFAVKVLDSSGSGTNSGVIKGMDFVISDSSGQECPNGVVVNMSLGGFTSRAVNDAADQIVGAGLFLAVAAGNQALDASISSPASAESACTVAAMDNTDTHADFSNFGSLIDIYGPGVDVLSTWPGGRTAILSGTSMATPHIAGLGAYYLGLGAATADEMCGYIASGAQIGVLSSVPNGTINALAQNGETQPPSRSVAESRRRSDGSHCAQAGFPKLGRQ